LESFAGARLTASRETGQQAYREARAVIQGKDLEQIIHTPRVFHFVEDTTRKKGRQGQNWSREAPASRSNVRKWLRKKIF